MSSFEQVARGIAKRLSGAGPDRPSLYVAAPSGGVEEWCQRVLRERFQTEPWKPHHPRVRELRERAMISSCASIDTRVARASEYGFRFGAFRGLLDAVGFWNRLERLTGESLHHFDPITSDDDVFLRGLNILNGNVHLDYEAMLTSDAELYFLDCIKRGMPGTVSVGHEDPSSCSMIHIIGAMIFGALMCGRGETSMQFIAQLNGVTFAVDSTNDECIDAYQRLDGRRYGRGDVVDLLRLVAGELKLSRDHIGNFDPVGNLGRGVDLFVPLIGFGFGMEPVYARALAMIFLMAFVRPTGDRTPYEMKLVGRALSAHSEAMLVTASLLAREPPHYYGGIPDMPALPLSPPVASERILLPELRSFDTPGNAINNRALVEALGAELGHRPRVVIVASGSHSARAYAEFKKTMGDIAAVSVYLCLNPGHEIDAGEKVNMLAIVNWVGENLKRLYGIGEP